MTNAIPFGRKTASARGGARDADWTRRWSEDAEPALAWYNMRTTPKGE